MKTMGTINHNKKLFLILLVLLSFIIMHEVLDRISILSLKEVQKALTTTTELQKAATQIKASVELLQNQQNCSAIDSYTTSCPYGKETSPNLHQKMIEHYGHLDHAMLEKCLQLELPLNEGSPKECWPRIFILASYPTSGNKLAKLLTTTMLQTNQLLNQYEERCAAPSYRFKVFNKFGVRVSSMCNLDGFNATHLPIPMMGKAAIFKTHGPKGWSRYINRPNWAFTEDFFPQEDETYPSAHTHGIIQLTRNPGDHILRDRVRWRNWCRDWNSTRCKNKLDDLCPQMADKARSWNNWHTFWFNKTKFPKTPYFFYAYEHFSNAKLTTKVTEKLLNFIGESPMVDGSEIEKLVKEPSYVHGTLAAKYCGVDVAREVHEVTKEVTERLGYKFDYESAAWSIPDP